MLKKPNALPHTLFTFILYFIKKQWVSFSAMFCSGIVWAINTAYYPYFVKLLVDKMTALKPGLAEPFRLLASPLIGIVTLWLLSEVFGRLYGIVSVYTWPTFRKNIRIALLAYTQGHTHSYFSKHFTGGLSNTIAELPRACEHIVTIFIGNFFWTLLTFCISLHLIYKTNMIFSLILLGFILIFIGITFSSIDNIKQKSTLHAETIATLNGQIVNSLGNMLTVRLFARSLYELHYLSRYQTNEIEKAQQASWAIQQDYLWKGMLSFLFIAITFVTIIYTWNRKWISTGDIALITTTFLHLTEALWHAGFHIIQIAQEIGVSKAALSTLNSTNDTQNNTHNQPLLIAKGGIYFNKVTFSYAPDSTLFKQLSIKIDGGQKIGLVGCSGSGKSTFIHLILRLYDLNEGKILIDNQDIAHVEQRSLYEQISVIPQHPNLFHRTIFDNIHYGRLDATEAEVLEAARLAYCEEFISILADGWQTLVGENGIKLSGGQRQRIAIARTILKNAPILIMDEATSALDSFTEHFIQKNLHGIMKHCTTLVVAHRLSTLNHMDRILVFQQGSIVEEGTLEELLAIKGYFFQLWEMQTGGLLPTREE